MNTSLASLACGVLVASSLGLAWLEALRLLLREGQWIDDGPERLLEVRPLALRIASVADDDPIIQTWADHGRIELMLRKYSSCEIVAGYKVSYGRLLYDNAGVDQISWVVERLRAKPETKAATITMHRPGEIELSCLSLLDFKLRNDELDMTAVYRSQNVFASQPGNILALRRVQCDVAERLGFPAGNFDLFALSAHVYKQDIDRVKELLEAVPPNTVGAVPVLSAPEAIISVGVSEPTPDTAESAQQGTSA
jgi:thymidylate synthase